MEQRAGSNFHNAIFRVLSSNEGTEGVAFAVASGVLVTCTHVVVGADIDGEGRLTVVHLSTGRRYVATIVRRYSKPATEQDVATLRIRKSSNYQTVELASFPPRIGDRLQSYGFPEPKNIEGMPGRGLVIGQTTEAGHPVWAVQSTQFTAGFSGAPVIEEASGLVYGMVMSVTERDKLDRLSDTTFIVPASTISSVCPLARLAIHPELSRYLESLQSQLDRSTYFLPGLPSISLKETFQPPKMFKMLRAGSSLTVEEIQYGRFVDAVASRAALVALLGDAGCGKSTILRHSAMSLSSQRQNGGDAVPVYLRARNLAAANGLSISERIRAAALSDSFYSIDAELRPNFMTEWPKSFGVRFIVFIDACDEINDLRERVLFLRYLREDLAKYLTSLGHSLIISSRDIGQLDAIKRDFAVYSVGELYEDAPLAIAHAIVGIHAAQFPQFLERLTNRHLTQSPLLVLLLLTIYLNSDVNREHKDWNVKSIYECYFELASSELRQRGISASVSSDAIATSQMLMEIVAWQDVSGSFDAESVILEFADFLVRQTGRGSFFAERDSRSLFRYLTEDAGIFFLSADRLSWTHQNFRDYLAACSCIRRAKSSDSIELCQLVEDSWDDPSKETLARLLVCMASMDSGLSRLISSKIESTPLFVPFLARAVADGALLPQKTSDELATRLFRTASAAFGTCRNLFTATLEDPVAALRSVVWKEPFLTIALEVVSGRTEFENMARPEDFKIEIAKVLCRTVGCSRLDDILGDSGFSPEVRRALLARV